MTIWRKKYSAIASLSACLLLSGCSGGIAALQVVQTGAIGAMAYHTWTKEDPPLYTAECAWAERIESDRDDLATRWTRAELIQVANHNDRYDCHCRHIDSACARGGE